MLYPGDILALKYEMEFHHLGIIVGDLKSATIEFEENISVKLDYEHPEGYVGFFDPDYLPLEIKDSRLPNADYYHLIPVNPPNQILSVTGEVLIDDRIYPLCGNISMDMITVDLGQNPFSGSRDCQIWGKSPLSIENLAEKYNILPYEFYPVVGVF